MADSDYLRARAFEQRRLHSSATEVAELGWGRAFLNTELASVFDLNHVLVTGPDVPPIAAVVDVTDEILGGAGMRHRKLLVEEGVLSETAGTELASRGFRHGANVVMAKRRPFDRVVDTDGVEEVGLERFLPLQEEFIRGEPWATSDAVVEAILGVARLVAATGARFFATAVDGTLVSGAHLYPGDGIAQIEEVITLEPYRRRGLARRVVTHVTRLMIEDGHGLVFLTADAKDWPRQLYTRLGYDAIGRYHDFTMWPEARDE